MLLDAANQLANAQAVTSTAFSQNTIDFSVLRNPGAAIPLHILFGVDVSAAAAGAATVTFQVVASTSPSLTSPVVLASSGPVPKADLVAGRSPFSISVPPASVLALPLGHRYVGAQFVVGSGPLTAGSFSAWLTDREHGGWKLFSSGRAIA